MTTDERKFEGLLDYLRRVRGFDFTGYKRPSLMRRIAKRMQLVDIADFAEYMDYLEVHPEEFALLFNHILINVTSFFRDPPCWEYLARHVVPLLGSAGKDDRAIRVWSAGCATGEEAYSLAILFAEAIGREGVRKRVKIYASDVDEEALGVARQGAYNQRDLQALPPALRRSYFEISDGRAIFNPDLRRSVIFGRHDLVMDAPISRLDLIVCRNTLMYLNAETQARILSRLHYALNDGGFVFFGKAEMMLTQAQLFKPVDLKSRIFSKVPHQNQRDRLLILAQASNHDAPQMDKQVQLREMAFDCGPVAQVVVDGRGTLLAANERARTLFRLVPKDLGRPLSELDLAYKPVDLRPLLERAHREERTITVGNIEHRVPGEGTPCYLDAHVSPLIDNKKVSLGAAISFVDVSGYYQVRDELQRSQQELETAYEEQQSTNEELETTNEELQSTNEELETTNEELQSTNEELETMNEELQASNEELETVNEELQQRTEELRKSNTFLNSILGSLRAGVVVLDGSLAVQIWNRRAEDLWGLRADEVQGKPFLTLDFGLPVDALAKPIRSVLGGETETRPTMLEAVDRRGKRFRCRVRYNHLQGRESLREGVILLMDEMVE